MQSAPETVRAALAQLDIMARAYADALVAHTQAMSDDAPARRESYATLLVAHDQLHEVVRVVAALT